METNEKKILLGGLCQIIGVFGFAICAIKLMAEPTDWALLGGFISAAMALIGIAAVQECEL